MSKPQHTTQPISSQDGGRILRALALAVMAAKCSMHNQHATASHTDAAIDQMAERISEHCARSVVASGLMSVELTSLEMVGIAGAVIHEDIQACLQGTSPAQAQAALPVKTEPDAFLDNPQSDRLLETAAMMLSAARSYQRQCLSPFELEKQHCRRLARQIFDAVPESSPGEKSLSSLLFALFNHCGDLIAPAPASMASTGATP